MKAGFRELFSYPGRKSAHDHPDLISFGGFYGAKKIVGSLRIPELFEKSFNYYNYARYDKHRPK